VTFNISRIVDGRSRPTRRASRGDAITMSMPFTFPKTSAGPLARSAAGSTKSS
jgi:hypothetical protein